MMFNQLEKDEIRREDEMVIEEEEIGFREDHMIDEAEMKN